MPTPLSPAKRSRHSRRRRSGLTLIEVAMSILITSTVMVGLGSSMLIASHAVPNVQGAAEVIGKGGLVLSQMTGELQFAVGATEMTATAVTFTVPARGTDIAPETIRYAWGGVAGNPLTRQYNGGAVVNVITNVQSLALTYKKYTQLKGSPATTHYFLSNVAIALGPGPSGTPQINARAEVLNHPDVAGP